jgi:hypothetical protein
MCTFNSKQLCATTDGSNTTLYYMSTLRLCNVTTTHHYKQPCPAGFYCEAASSSPRGSGLCPRGFYCPESTAVPVPTPKGYFADLEGMVQGSECLPGYYAPTIETTKCYPCPPGTKCEADGASIADICPPGTYRFVVYIVLSGT